MRRGTRMAALTSAAAVAVLVWPATGADAGGGGCHRAALGQTEGVSAATVELKDNCFEPTVLRVDPGAEVTFVNRDGRTHYVEGVGWGALGEPIGAGESTTERFVATGTYPYSCRLHIGMNGAVVVGDGTGAGQVVDAVRPVSVAPAVGGRTPARQVEVGETPWWPVAGAVPLAAAVGFLSGRRRRGRVVEPDA